jgi:hypothetical protein
MTGFSESETMDIHQYIQKSAASQRIGDADCDVCKRSAQGQWQSVLLVATSNILVIELNARGVILGGTTTFNIGNGKYQVDAIVARIGDKIDTDHYVVYMRSGEGLWLHWNPANGFMRETFDKALPRRYCPSSREHHDTKEAAILICTLMRREKVGTVSLGSTPQVTSLLNGIHVGPDATEQQEGSNAIDLDEQETPAP